MNKSLNKLLISFLIIVSFLHIAFAESDSNKVKIGMLLSLSGNFASVGEDCQKGIEAALDIANARDSLEVYYANSTDAPKIAISEFKKLVNVNKVLGVYTHRSAIGMPLNPVSLKLGVPLLGAVGNKNFADQNEYAYQVWAKSDDEGGSVAEELVRRKYKQVAMLHTEDAWTTTVSDGFREKFSELKGNLVFDQVVQLSETDFRSLLTKIKQQSPDAIYMNLLLPQIGPILKQARELGIKSDLYTNFYVARKDVAEAVGTKVLEGVRYVEFDTDLPVLKEKLGMDENGTPAGLTVASYVGTMLVAQAVAEARDLKSSSDLQKSLLLQKEVRTPDHVYPVENRYIQFPLVVKIMRNGKGQKEAQN